MIHISPLIEEEEVSVTQAKERGADAIEKTDGQEERENSEQNPVNIKSIAWPRLNPGKTGIFKEEGRVDPPSRNAMKRPNHLDHPEHDNAECDPEKNERRDVDPGKQVSL